MKRIPGLLGAAALLSLAFATVAFGQQSTAEGIVVRQRVFQGPEGAPPPPPDANFVFVASESIGGKTVKGAPYSAEAVTETIRSLADGNRIVNRNTSAVYRDSEGRTRREHSLKSLGIFGGGGEEPQTIFINDPVANVTYALDPRTRTAHKSLPFTFESTNKPGNRVESQRFEVRVSPPTTAAAASGNVIMTAPLPEPGATVREAHPEVGPDGTGTIVFRSKPSNTYVVSEKLGTQLIEGVEAEGTRGTITIPAGEIGNERAIEIVSEHWYSKELQLMVMTRHNDPRFGETTYKLTNINRAEPAKSLFEVPAGYTVKEGPQFGPAIAPLRTRRPAHPE